MHQETVGLPDRMTAILMQLYLPSSDTVNYRNSVTMHLRSFVLFFSFHHFSMTHVYVCK